MSRLMVPRHDQVDQFAQRSGVSALLDGVPASLSRLGQVVDYEARSSMRALCGKSGVGAVAMLLEVVGRGLRGQELAAS